jgi:hypothetical protein
VKVPEPAHHVAASYLATVDQEAPGLIEGLYLVGSVALDDFHPRTSDIDFVAVTDRPLDLAAVEALRRVHAQMAKRHPKPLFNGPYVTWEELAADPRHADPGAHVRGKGVVKTGVRAERHPVTWHTLARYGITLRGPHPCDIDIWTNRTGLAASMRQNLDEYWRPWHARSSRLLTRPGLATLTKWGPEWGVLGVSRLHYTLATGEITSKDGAGVYARTTFRDRWQKIIDECLRTAGPTGEHTWTVRRSASGAGTLR